MSTTSKRKRSPSVSIEKSGEQPPIKRKRRGKNRNRKPAASKSASQLHPVSHAEESTINADGTDNPNGIKEDPKVPGNTKLDPALLRSQAAEALAEHDGQSRNSKKTPRNRPNKPRPSSKPKSEARADESEPMKRSREGHFKEDAWKGSTALLERARATPWTISPPLGGRFIDAPPVFAHEEADDESVLILANASALQVFSTATSYLKRSIVISSPDSRTYSVVGFALSEVDPTKIYVITSGGFLYRIDWQNGKRLGQWRIATNLRGIEIAKQNGQDGAMDVIFTKEIVGMARTISTHLLSDSSEIPKVDSKIIYTCAEPIARFQVLQEGRVVILASKRHLTVGVSKTNPGTTSARSDYSWKDIVTNDPIVSLDARASSPENTPAPSLGQSHEREQFCPRVDVIIGDARGSIFIYYNLLDFLIEENRHRSTFQTRQLTPQRLHWHREQVLSLRWSRDGNYIISGGHETVLVIWQLDTGKQQYLPHLAAPIENIVVSPEGSQYALSLSDNSTMVLSTSELSPTTHILGIQSKYLPTAEKIHNFTRTINSESSFGRDMSAHVQSPAVLSPIETSHLLIAVPPFQASSSKMSGGASYLQTFDVTSSRHVSRQALTRTNVTNINMGPEGNKIEDPETRFLRISHDGLWLASVDVWAPPTQDVSYLAVDEDDALEKKTERLETFLRFWTYNRESKEWELVTRVDAPHTSPVGPGAGAVLDLQADPSSINFATIGEDGAVRIWRPKTRLRNNVVVRGASEDGLTSWSCKRTVHLGQSLMQASLGAEHTTVPAHSLVSARLAYSADGSALAASYQTSTEDDRGLVHFIDPSAGKVHHSRPRLYSGQLTALAFVERYLVTISGGLLVWNTVLDAPTYGLAFQDEHVPLAERASCTHLAVDQSSGTFAVAIPSRKSSRFSRRNPLSVPESELSIFDPTNPCPLFSTRIADTVTALLPATGQSQGYFVLDAAAHVRKLTPKIVFTYPALPTPEPSDGESLEETRTNDISTLIRHGDNKDSQDMVDAQESSLRGLSPVTGTYESENEDGEGIGTDVRVVRPEQLAEVFDTGPAAYSTPVGELFTRVVNLFVGK
ncbi:MAG: hypothetical protein M1833_003722 [Piccolia ochrophora]|nr:MAG: hypothetical protein M1833_003722 [Piccolia ochrophora]